MSEIVEDHSDTMLVESPAQGSRLTVKPYDPIAEGLKLLHTKHGKVLESAPDLTTPDALKEARASLRELIKFRTSLEAARIKEKEASLTYGRLVDAEAKRLKAEAAPYELAYEKAIQAEEARLERIKRETEAREAARRAALNERVMEIRNTPILCAGKSVSHLTKVRDALAILPVDASFEEYFDDACSAKKAALTTLESMLVGAMELEREREALERERIERLRVEAIKARISDITGLLTTAAMARTAARIAPLLERCNAVSVDDSFAEFRADAEAAKTTTLEALQAIHSAKVEAEAQAVQLAEQAANQKVEQERLDLQRRQRGAVVGAIVGAIGVTSDGVGVSGAGSAALMRADSSASLPAHRLTTVPASVTAPSTLPITRPTDRAILQAVMLTFGATAAVALQWLQEFDHTHPYNDLL